MEQGVLVCHMNECMCTYVLLLSSKVGDELVYTEYHMYGCMSNEQNVQAMLVLVDHIHSRLHARTRWIVQSAKLYTDMCSYIFQERFVHVHSRPAGDTYTMQPGAC
jgi:hypothetical protein